MLDRMDGTEGSSSDLSPYPCNLCRVVPGGVVPDAADGSGDIDAGAGGGGAGAVWFLFPGLLFSYPTRAGLSELWAVVAEACGYVIIWPALGPRRSALVSLVANAGSFLLGLLIVRF